MSAFRKYLSEGNAGRKASDHASTTIERFADVLRERCWKGYKPVKGKKPYSKGSCTKESYKHLGDAILNELRGKYASKRYFDNERKGKRSDRKTYRGHIKFQAKRDDAQARGKIAPPGRGYDDEPETNPNR